MRTREEEQTEVDRLVTLWEELQGHDRPPPPEKPIEDPPPDEPVPHEIPQHPTDPEEENVPDPGTPSPGSTGNGPEVTKESDGPEAGLVAPYLSGHDPAKPIGHLDSEGVVHFNEEYLAQRRASFDSRDLEAELGGKHRPDYGPHGERTWQTAAKISAAVFGLVLWAICGVYGLVSIIRLVLS